MTTGTDPISMLLNQQSKQQAGADEKGISDAFEVVLKIIFWVVDHIPFINTWFLNHYNSTIPDTAAKTFKQRELIQLSAFPAPLSSPQDKLPIFNLESLKTIAH